MADVDTARLKELASELSSDLETIALALAQARERLARLDERLSTTGSAWPAKKRQGRFYWGIFLAGGEPEGEYVTETQINQELKKLTLDGKKETVAQMRKSIEGRAGQHFTMKEGRYKLRDEALPVLKEFREIIDGIPAEISI